MAKPKTEGSVRHNPSYGRACGGRVVLISEDWLLYACVKCAALLEDDGKRPYRPFVGSSVGEALNDVKAKELPPELKVVRHSGKPELGELIAVESL